MGKGENKFLNSIKATRITRTFPSLLLIILACSISNKWNLEIIFLGISLLLIYSFAGIQNALKDKDHEVTKETKIISFIPLFIALIISTLNIWIFIASVSWILLGIFYNTKSRKILFLDTTILGITHYFLPLFTSLVLLENSIGSSFKTAIPIYLITWFILPIKNLKETKKDEKLGYKTLTTKYKNGKEITIISFVSSIFLLIAYLYLIGTSFFYIEFIAIIYLVVLISIRTEQEKLTLKLTRLLFLIFFFILIIINTKELNFIFWGISIIILFLPNFLKK